MIVEWLGGPDDGKQITLPDGTYYLKVPVPRPLVMTDILDSPFEPNYDIFEVPVNGGYLLWNERVKK